MSVERDVDLFSSLVYLADTLVSNFDVVDLADRLVHTCRQIDGVSDAGIMLHDQRQSLRVLAATSDETELLELLELQNQQGPCLEAFRSGEVTWPLTSPSTASGGRSSSPRPRTRAFAVPPRSRCACVTG